VVELILRTPVGSAAVLVASSVARSKEEPAVAGRGRVVQVAMQEAGAPEVVAAGADSGVFGATKADRVVVGHLTFVPSRLSWPFPSRSSTRRVSVLIALHYSELRTRRIRGGPLLVACCPTGWRDVSVMLPCCSR
jgi:hypothetical protein